MKKDLSIKELLVMGGALFSMHFGAACMLFPVQWGKDAGTALWHLQYSFQRNAARRADDAANEKATDSTISNKTEGR